MRYFPIIFSSLALFALPSCSQQEKEQEPDYENMVMADDEEGEWSTLQDQKTIAGDLPDPQELIIIE